MNRCDLDAVVATSPPNVTYTSGFYMWLDSLFKRYMIDPGGSSDLFRRFVLVPREGESAFIIDRDMQTNAAETWIDDVYVGGEADMDSPVGSVRDAAADLAYLPGRHRHPTTLQCLVEAIRSRGLEHGRIGVELEGLSADSGREIRSALGTAQVLDCTNLLRLIRMVKTHEEMQRMARAAEIGEAATDKALALCQPGVSTRELAQCFRCGVSELGADFDHFAFSIAGYGIATEPDYRLTAHDMMYVDYGCRYGYYYSDAGTTFSMQPLRKSDQDLFDTVEASMAAGVDALKPGLPASAAHEAMRQVLEANGLFGQYPHGHGMGLELRDYPILVANNGRRIKDDCVDLPSDLPLEEDMVLNLEVGIFLPNYGSLQNEQTFVVTSDGSRPLVEQNRSRPVTPDNCSTG